MEGHGLEFYNVDHQAYPPEDSDKEIDGPLDTLWIPCSDEAAICIKRAHNPYQHHPESVMNSGLVFHCK